MKLLTTLLGLTLVALPALADDTNKPPPRPVPKEKGPCSGTATVAAGSSATNGDGVKVINNAASSGECNLTPKDGAEGCKSFANAKNGFSGSITGMDGNDFTVIGSSCNATVSGTGGTVSIGPGSTVLVVNTGGPTAGNMVVNWSGGPSIVLPGNSLLIHS